MIHPDSRTLNWIEEQHIKHPRLDLQLIEKSIRAFSLLESLALSGCPFCFKGGTCVMLHLNSSKRLSVDIDIICPPGTDITQYIMQNADKYGFVDVKLVERLSPHNVPKSHAKFYYKVTYRTNAEEDNILLDVLFEDIHYGEVTKLPIQSPFLKMEGEPVMVTVPSAADILGDKLTAFAPHTTGIPYFKGRRRSTAEVIKQMFDISSLFDIVDNLNATADTFNKFAEVELGYRELAHLTATDVLDDAINTALTLTLRGTTNKEEFDLLVDGIKRIDSFIVKDRYVIEDAIVDAAKAAYVASMIKTGRFDLQKYSGDPNEIKEIEGVKHLNTKLNKLKKSNPEAFYYWSLVDKLQD